MHTFVDEIFFPFLYAEERQTWKNFTIASSPVDYINILLMPTIFIQSFNAISQKPVML